MLFGYFCVCSCFINDNLRCTQNRWKWILFDFFSKNVRFLSFFFIALRLHRNWFVSKPIKRHISQLYIIHTFIGDRVQNWENIFVLFKSLHGTVDSEKSSFCLRGIRYIFIFLYFNFNRKHWMQCEHFVAIPYYKRCKSIQINGSDLLIYDLSSENIL